MADFVIARPPLAKRLGRADNAAPNHQRRDTRMIRLASFGLDKAAQTLLASRLRGVELVCDLDAENANPPADCDAVALWGSPSSANELALTCLADKKPVLLAADLCTSSEMLGSLYEAVKSSGTQLWCVNPDRFMPSRQLIREQLEKGHLGDVGLVRSHRWTERPSAGLESSIELPPVLARDLDLALWYVGREPSRAYAVSRPVEADRSRGDLVNVHLGFRGGAKALLDYARRTPPGHGYQSLSVIGSTGAGYADDHQNMQLVFAAGGAPRAVQTGEGIRPLVALVQAFVDGLAAGRDLSSSVAQWQAVLRVRDGLQRSIESGQAITWEGA